MGASIAFALLGYAVVLLPLLWLVREVVLAITAPRRAPREPACEKCRYPVAGLATFTCPECGTDLRATGIISRVMEMRRRSSTGAAVAAWLLVWAWLAAIGTLVLGRMYSAGESMETFWIGVLGAWLVIGAMVTWLIVRRRRRLMREFAPDPAAPPAPEPAHNAGA